MSFILNHKVFIYKLLPSFRLYILKHLRKCKASLIPKNLEMLHLLTFPLDNVELSSKSSINAYFIILISTAVYLKKLTQSKPGTNGN